MLANQEKSLLGLNPQEQFGSAEISVAYPQVACFNGL